MPTQNPEREPLAQTDALTARSSAPTDQVLLFSHLLYHTFLQAEDTWQGKTKTSNASSSEGRERIKVR